MKGAIIALGILLMIIGFIIAFILGPTGLGALVGFLIFLLGVIIFLFGIAALLADFLAALFVNFPPLILIAHQSEDDDFKEWAREVLDKVKKLIEKLDKALEENWDRDRLLRETKDILCELLTLIEERIDELFEMAGFEGLTARLLKRLLRNAIKEVRKRLDCPEVF